MKKRLSIVGATGCGSCAFQPECGGLPDEQQSLFGCLVDCGSRCGGTRCDWVCPLKPDFVDHVREVGGLDRGAPIAIQPFHASRLSTYVPMVRHASARTGLLERHVVALSLEDVVKQRADGSYGPRAATPEEFRAQFGLRSDAEVIVVSVARDSVIERYWALRRKHDVPAMLKRLGLLCMTVPNFSLFSDGPRVHALWNRRRMERAAEELSAAGIPIVPHLNAASPRDWAYWRSFLADHPTIVCVAKEFRTGLRRRVRALAAIDDLASLQQSLGRALHPIVVGGSGHASVLGARFARATLVDSDPFIKTMKRRMRRLTGGWETKPTEGALDGLLATNIERHAQHCDEAFRRGAARDEAA